MRLQRLEISGFKSFCDRSELCVRPGRHRDCRPQRLRQEQRGRRHRVGARRTERQEPARRPHGRRHLQRQRRAQARRGRRSAPAARPACRSSNPARPGTPGDLVDDEGKPLLREVEVTRRLYRSGESEYLINGDVVRLKDVHELLMDTGLGAKAYAIIEQGKIGMILSTRPTDRRQLIEEAAGVTKYKARRRAAELKLDASQQNLTRIDDIIFEVEKQRGTLKRQASKARRYQRLRDELRRWEKVQFARRQRVLAQAIESADARIADVRAREAAAAGRPGGPGERPRAPAPRGRAARVGGPRRTRDAPTPTKWRSAASSSGCRATSSSWRRWRGARPRWPSRSTGAAGTARPRRRTGRDRRRQDAERAAQEREDGRGGPGGRQRRTDAARRACSRASRPTSRRSAANSSRWPMPRRRCRTPSRTPWPGAARVSGDLARLATERDDLEIESSRIAGRTRTDGRGARRRPASRSRRCAKRDRRRTKQSSPTCAASATS